MQSTTTTTTLAKEDKIYAFSVGIDWADQSHAVCQRRWADGQRQNFKIASDPASVRAWLSELKAQAGPQARVLIGFEQSRNSLFELLRAQGDWLELYPLNPLTLSKYREALFTSGAKDDPLDSQLIEELIFHHRDRLRAYEPLSPEVRKLDLLCQQRRKAVDAATACKNELSSALKVFYPLALGLHDGLDSSLSLHFLKRWPTFEQLKKAKPNTLRSFYYQHHSRSQSLIQERLEKIASAQPVTDDAALIEPLVLTLQRLVGQLLSLHSSIASFDKAIKELFARHPAHPIFESLPGAGDQLAPRLLAAFGCQPQADCSEMLKKSAIAPVLERSGKSSAVRRRYFRNKFLHQTFFEFAGCSIPHCSWAKAFYTQAIARGKTHNVALRALAFKWIRIIAALWRTRTPYDETHYLQVLTRRHSPLRKIIPIS
jgi:Transposase/Transposase IS116/IS110/IS902 family